MEQKLVHEQKILDRKVDRIENEVKNIDRDVHVTMAKSIMSINERSGDLEEKLLILNSILDKRCSQLQAQMESRLDKIESLVSQIKENAQRLKERRDCSTELGVSGSRAIEKPQRVRRQTQKYDPSQ